MSGLAARVAGASSGTDGVTSRPVATDPEFRYSDLLPTGPDDTPYRLVTTEGVSTFEAERPDLPPGRARGDPSG